MDASADVPRRSFAFGLERAGFVGLAWPRLTVVLVILVSILAGVGPDAPQGRRFALGAVPHRHRGVPPLRGDRSPISVQRVRRAGRGRGQGPPEEGAARGLPPRHHRPAAGRRRGRHRVDAVCARQAGRHRLCGADRARRAARRAAYDAIIATLKGNEIVAGKFLSDDGELALAVLALDRTAVQEQGAKQIIGSINDTAEQGTGRHRASSRT